MSLPIAAEVWAEMKTYKEQLIPDFRRFYNVSWFDVGRGVGIEEAFYLLQSLATNTESQYCVKRNNFKSAFTSTDQILLDTLELTANVNSKKKIKLPRPWDVNNRKLGSARGVSPMKVKELLAKQAKLKKQEQ